MLLVWAMEGEGSPVIDIMGDVLKALLLEASMASSSSDSSSVGAANNVAKAVAEDAMNLRELARSYDFRMSSISWGTSGSWNL
jgi:hypothetical protein